MQSNINQTDFLKTLAEKSDQGVLRGNYAHADAQYVVAQNWAGYTQEHHALWRKLYQRQAMLLPGRACDLFIENLGKLDTAESIPQFDQVSVSLQHATGWRLVAVPGLVPDQIFLNIWRIGVSLSRSGCVSRTSLTMLSNLICSMIFLAMCRYCLIQYLLIIYRNTAKVA